MYPTLVFKNIGKKIPSQFTSNTALFTERITKGIVQGSLQVTYYFQVHSAHLKVSITNLGMNTNTLII